MTGWSWCGPWPADEAVKTLDDRRLYLCTPDRPDLARFLQACISGGVDVVQLRDKHLDARSLLSRARLAASVCRDHGVPFVLNDRPDLALEVGVGVHVGQDDAPASLARRLLGPGAMVGLSTHAPAELDAAACEPVDYISVGPVRATPTKPGRPGTGIEYLSYAAGRSERPWFVTGGVQPATVAPLVAAGARRFVVVRWITEAADPLAAARSLSEAIARAVDHATVVSSRDG